ncbi:MAG: DUF481 domain-containing protein [Candidatus Omnitrophica bacterium]|nr:DUF481 domain-containing protein [Candidatus Omnitrophota bacterium]
MKKVIFIWPVISIICLSAAFTFASDDGLWKQEVTLGYTQKTGNTQSTELVSNYEGIRKTDYSELTIKAGVLYSAVNKKMDGQKYNGSMRYAPELGDTDWFGFGKIETEHDRFAGIDYRYLPSLGAGYWIAREEGWKASGEVGVGHEYVKYTDGSDDDNVVLIPRFFAEKAVLEKAKISEELIFYPNLEDVKKYRFRSESRFTNALSESLSLRVSFIDEVNTNPLGASKKNDTQLVFALIYGF